MAEEDAILQAPIDPEEEAHSGARGKLTPMSPGEALAQLREGKLLQNVTVERLYFRGKFEQPVRMKNCVLVKPRFDGATFDGEVSFSNCTIDRPTFSGATVFNGDLSLGSSTLQAADLINVTVKGAFNCGTMQTRGKFGLTKCRFEGKVNFWDATFHNWVNVKATTFAGEADFRSLHAQKGMSFIECRFEGIFLFRGSAVAPKFDLGNSHFERLIDLSRAKFNDYAYLENISQGPGQRFAFENCVGERLLVRPEQVIGRLASEEAGDHKKAMQEYAYLKRAYQSLHRYDEEDWAFYRFKVNQRRGRPCSWRRPWQKVVRFFDWLLLDLGCGYGANPLRAVRAALVIILFFAVIYMTWAEKFHIAPEKLPFPCSQGEISWPNRVMIGITVSAGTFTSGMGGIKELAKDWMNLALLTESLLGTLLWGLFIVSFSRKVIR